MTINQSNCKFSAAIAEEKRIQRETIKKQRDDYIRRASALKRELITLKEQREELVTGNAPPSPTTVGFVKENDRLQVNTKPHRIDSVAITSVTLHTHIFFFYAIYHFIHKHKQTNRQTDKQLSEMVQRAA